MKTLCVPLPFVAFAGLVVLQPLSTSAQISVTSRTSQITTNACAPVCDTKNASLTDPLLGTHDLERLSASSAPAGDSASARATINSQATISGNVLEFSGTVSGNASANAVDFIPNGSGNARTLISGNADSAYNFTVTGSISVPQGRAKQNRCIVRIRGNGVVYEEDLTGAGTRTLSGSGALTADPEGTFYSIEVMLFTLSEAGGSNPPGSDSSQASINFEIRLEPGAQPTPTPGPIIRWKNPAGGSFNTDTNWDPQTVPGSNSTAIFGLQTNYTVNVGTAATNRLEVRNGNVTFTDLDYSVGATTFDPASILLDNARLTLASGVLAGVHALIGESAASRVDVNASAFWTLSGSLRVGGPGEGLLAIADGGAVLSSEGRIGTGIGGGEVALSGPGAGWGSGNLAVGFSGNGTLTLSDGAFVTSDTGRVAFGPGTTGEVTIRGAGPGGLGSGSRWTLNDELIIGEGGTGTVEVLDLGELLVRGKTTVDGDLLLTNGAASDHNSQPVTIGKARSGQATVRGFDPSGPIAARMILISDLTVGELEASGLSLEEGGFVSCTNATFGVGAEGAVVVSGFGSAPSELTVASQLTVGKSAFSTLEIHDGAETHARDITVGTQAGGIGFITVTGRSSAGPSFLSASGNLVLGLEGRGLLVIEEDAVVTCFGAALGVFAGAEGRAELGVENAPGAAARWVVNGDLTLGGIGRGDVILHNSANVTVGGTLFILSNGFIGGTGTFSAGFVQNGGTLAPGNSPGRLDIAGNYEQTASGTLKIQAGGLSAGQFDILHVTGNATLGGRLEVTFLDGYLPRTGDTFRFLEVDGNITGQFAQVVFPQLLPGFQFETVVAPGGLQFNALNDAVLRHRALNISTRMRVESGDNVLIGGFILTGNDAKKVILRAIGPSLAGVGLPGFLADPTLELRDSSGALLASNDNWRIGGQEAEIIASTVPPTNDLESAIVRTLPVGAYTAIVRGNNGGLGVGLVEAYDLDPNVDSKLANISTRGRVQTGDNVMIGGFIVGGGGGGTTRVIVRAIGPSVPVPGALPDPMLELRDGNGALLASNDNWRTDQEAEIIATSVPPTNDLESAIVRTLAPGPYTAIVRGVNGATGVALVEVYTLD